MSGIQWGYKFLSRELHSQTVREVNLVEQGRQWKLGEWAELPGEGGRCFASPLAALCYSPGEVLARMEAQHGERGWWSKMRLMTTQTFTRGDFVTLSLVAARAAAVTCGLGISAEVREIEEALAAGDGKRLKAFKLRMQVRLRRARSRYQGMGVARGENWLAIHEAARDEMQVITTLMAAAASGVTRWRRPDTGPNCAKAAVEAAQGIGGARQPEVKVTIEDWLLAREINGAKQQALSGRWD